MHSIKGDAEESDEENLVILSDDESIKPWKKRGSGPVAKPAHPPPDLDDGDVITLNVGGTTFVTTRETLTIPKVKRKRGEVGSDVDWFVALLSSGPPMNDGSYFIDRDGQFFAPILTYLRTTELSFPSSLMSVYDVRREAEYFGVLSLVQLIERSKRSGPGWEDPANDLTKREVLMQLNARPGGSDQPLLLHGLTLRRMDLKRTCLQNVQFHKCDMEGATFTGATFVDVTFHGSNLQDADFVLSKFKSGSSDGVINNPFSGRTNLEGSKFSAAAKIIVAMDEYIARWGYVKKESKVGTIELRNKRLSPQ